MTATRHPLAVEALAQATTPEAVAFSTVEPPTRDHYHPDSDAGMPHPQLRQYVDRLSLANALRHQAQQQVVSALSALAGSKHLNWARLASASPEEAPRKPRVILWAEVNARNTLQVFWCPVIDAALDIDASPRTRREHSDYVEIAPTWSAFGVHPQVLLRVKEEHYLAAVSPHYSWATHASGEMLVRDALMDSLSTLVCAVGTVCDVTVKTWPTYDKTGALILQSARGRAATILREKLAPLAAAHQTLTAQMADKLATLGLASMTEFEAAQAEAAAKNAKVSSTIFAKTGKRCSSITVDHLVRYQAQAAKKQAECENVRVAQASLADDIARWPEAA